MNLFFKELFEYIHHFNQQLATVFTARSSRPSERSIKFFNHILKAHRKSNGRITQDQNRLGVWDTHFLHELKEIDHTTYKNSISILDQPDLTNS